MNANGPIVISEYNDDKKDIKKLYELNQSLKASFTSYYISPNGLIYSKPDQFVVQKGVHFGRTQLKFFHRYDETIYIHSDSVFNYYKESKSAINALEIFDNEIVFDGEKKLYIGTVYPSSNYGLQSIWDSLPQQYKKDMQIATSVSVLFTPQITLAADIVESICGGNYQDISVDGFYTRITKELIPGIKKKHKVSIMLEYHPTDINLFTMLIKNVHGPELTTYHKYTCIMM